MVGDIRALIATMIYYLDILGKWSMWTTGYCDNLWAAPSQNVWTWLFQFKVLVLYISNIVLISRYMQGQWYKTVHEHGSSWVACLFTLPSCASPIESWWGAGAGNCTRLLCTNYVFINGCLYTSIHTSIHSSSDKKCPWARFLYGSYIY